MGDSLNEYLTEDEINEIKNNPEFQALISGNHPKGASPDFKDSDSLLKFFRDILALENGDYDKISRTGNLKDFELGGCPISSRRYLSLALYCETENLGSVAKFLRSRSNIILNTSLSRSAALLKFITTKRSLSGAIEPRSVETKSGLFGDKTVVRGGDEE